MFKNSRKHWLLKVLEECPFLLLSDWRSPFYWFSYVIGQHPFLLLSAASVWPPCPVHGPGVRPVRWKRSIGLPIRIFPQVKPYFRSRFHIIPVSIFAAGKTADKFPLRRDWSLCTFCQYSRFPWDGRVFCGFPHGYRFP